MVLCAQAKTARVGMCKASLDTDFKARYTDDMAVRKYRNFRCAGTGDGIW